MSTVKSSVLSGLAAGLLVLSGSPMLEVTLAGHDFAGSFAPVKPVPGIANPGQLEICLSVQPGGMTAHFLSDRKLFQATRTSPDHPFGDVQPLGPTINTTADGFSPVSGPTLTADGLVIVFARGPINATLWERSKLYEARRASTSEPFGQATPLPDAINQYTSFTPHLSADGLLLLFASLRPGGQGDEDIWVARRPSRNDLFGAPVNFNEFFPGSQVNSRYEEIAPSLSTDQLVLFFSDLDLNGNAERPGSKGGPDIWVSTRPDTQSPFGPPRNLNEFGLGSDINSRSWHGFPFLSRDWPAQGAKLYFDYRLGTETPVDTEFLEADWTPLRITNFRRSADGIQLDLNTGPGRAFQIQFKDDLSQSDWSTLDGPASLTAPASITIPIEADRTQRFYRVMVP